MNCPRCNHNIPEGASFCPECGAAIIAPPEPVAREAPQEEPAQIEVSQRVGTVEGGRVVGVDLGEVLGDVNIGNYTLRIGTLNGGVVNLDPTQQGWVPRTRPVPVMKLPRPFSGFLDRKAEVAAAAAVLEGGSPVEFYGPPGVGKTTLLHYLAHYKFAPVFPDGIVFFSEIRHRPVDAILFDLFDAFYERDVNQIPTSVQVRHALRDKHALIMLDDVDLESEEVSALMDAARGCTFLFASTERRLWDAGRSIALQGLPPPDALRLIERELGRPLGEEDRTIVQQLYAALEGYPLRFLQLGALVRDAGISLAWVAERLQQHAGSVGEALTAQLLATRSEDEQRVLAALAGPMGASVGEEHLDELGQVAQGTYIAQADHGSTAIVAEEYKEYRYEYAPPRPVDADTLQAAWQRLAELPLDEVPASTSLPQGSRINLSQNPLFVGRRQEFRALASSLKSAPEENVATVAITGMGGVGKTQLVSEFVHRYGRYFLEGVFWLSFADTSAVSTEVAACGGAGRMRLRPDFSILPLEEQVREVMSAWQTPLPRLLVFDNCEDEELLDRWRPPTGGCRVILTSRRQRWDPRLGVEVLSLHELDRQQSVKLLHKHRPDLAEDDQCLNDIADELGDLPLALRLAGRYLEHYRFVMAPADYLAQLRKTHLLEHRSLQQAKGTSPTSYERGLTRTFALSYNLLDAADSTDALAKELSARVSRFAPGEPIRRKLLGSTLDLPEDPDARLVVEDAIDRLEGLGFLEEQEEGALRMHRLVAVYFRGIGTDEDAQGAVEKALLKTVGPLIERGYPTPLQALLPHLRAVTQVAKGRKDEQAMLLCRQVGRCLRMAGAYAEARLYFEQALKICEETLGFEHPDTATSLDDLADLLAKQGGYIEARPLFERALSICEKAYGSGDLRTALHSNNLAILLTKQHDYVGARPLLERALAIRKEALGEKHPLTADTLNNLGLLLWREEHYDEARSLYERALTIREEALGAEHPETAVSLVNLAVLLRAQKEYNKARSLFEQALEIYKRVLGEKHPETARVREFLRNLSAQQKA